MLLDKLFSTIVRTALADARAKLYPDPFLPLEIVLSRLPGELSALEGGEAISLYAKTYAREFKREESREESRTSGHTPSCGCKRCDPAAV